MKQEVWKRASCSYENQSQKFHYKAKRKFDLQYSQLYTARYKLMKPKLVAAAKKKWGSGVLIKHLVNIEANQDCVIIGTLFRKMELQPGILKEICDDENVLPLPVTEKYSSDDDVLILEENQQRIQLIGDIELPNAITGVSIAAFGYESDGKFNVKEITYVTLPQHCDRVVDQSLTDGEDRYVLFISGLGIGGKMENMLRLQILIDLITGRISNEDEQNFFSKVCRVIIAGNSLSKDTEDKETEKLAKYLSRNTQAKSVLAMKSLDEVLVQLGSCVPVDIMPGAYDPTNQFMPQQPLHKCMFPNALSYPTVQGVTNPYKAIVGGKRVLGTSGQNISNIYQFSGFEDRLNILEQTLTAGHVSPTCPDTLSCYPYYDEDPFILQDAPDIYFAGNQPKFETRLIQDAYNRPVLLLLVPAFDAGGVAALVNLRDLSCNPITIDTLLE